MLKQKKSGFSFKNWKAVPKWVYGIAVVALFGIFMYTMSGVFFPQGTPVAQTGQTGGAGAQAVKNTAFNGSDLSTDDVAREAYCQDIVTAAEKGEGSKIRNLCALGEAGKYIATLSDEEITEVASERPLCLQTGYDEEGYSCLTGFNADGCSKSGVDVDGNACYSINLPPKKTNPIDSFVLDKAQICDVVSGCQSEQTFGPDGFNEFGCDRQGRNKDGDMCPAEYITRIYGSDGRDQLGFGKDGLNKFGCDARGYRTDGTQCPKEEVTRVFDRNNFDQWGFDPDGFNEKGCSVEGLDRSGNVCAIEDITRVYDPATGLDQFGVGKDGFNAKGCSLEGFRKDGSRCALEDIPRIFGKNGLDQNGLRRDGRNKFNCDLDGMKPNGDLCPIEETTRLFSPVDGKDQFGFFPNNRNENGCDPVGFKEDGTLCSQDEMTHVVSKKTGKGLSGLDGSGFNDKGCNLEGFRIDGKRCELSDIPRVFNESTGLDQFGIGKDGFNAKGCSADGFRADGTRCDLEDIPRIFDPETGLDQFGIGKDGFNEFGCSIEGLDREGKLCPVDKIPSIVDEYGFNQFGISKTGFSKDTGCNLQGFDREGKRCAYDDIPKIYDADGKNQLGFFENGRNENGCDVNGIKENGDICSAEEMTPTYDVDNMDMFHRDPEGRSRLGFGELGFNDNNCDINGLTPEGVVCDIADITHVYDPETGLDQFGLTKDGFNEWGCNLQGKNRNNEDCPADKIPRIFGKGGVDQLGNHITDLPESVWLAEKAKTENLKPLLDENGNPVMKDGKPLYVDRNGLVRHADGTPARDEKGGLLVFDAKSGKIVDSKGKPVSGITDKDGNPVIGGISAKSAKKSSSKALVDENGNPVMKDGKPLYVDRNGLVRHADGTPARDEKGGLLVFDAKSGKIVDSKGKPVSGITDKDGNPVIGGISAKSAKKSSSKALVDEDGATVFYKDKPAFVNEDGFLTDAEGKLFLDENGNPLRVNENGEVLNESGQVVGQLVDASGYDVDSVSVSDSQGEALSPLLDAEGKPVTYGGEQSFVNKDGFVTDKDGNLLLDENGIPMRLNDKGDVVNSLGESVDGFETIDGEPVTGKMHAKGGLKPGEKALSPMLGENGEIVYFNDEPAFVNSEGYLTDESGNLLLDENGKPLRLNELGQVVDSMGNVVPSSKFSDVNGKKLSGPFGKGELMAEHAVKAKAEAEKLSESVRKALGLDEDGYNAKGCALTGLDRMGNLCRIEDIPRTFDSVTGLDQFGIGKDNYNAFGCDLEGKDRKGNACPPEYITRLKDSDGFDQFGVNDAGLNRASMTEDGKNALGCDATGENCTISTTPLLTDSAGINQFGGDAEGKGRLKLRNGFNSKGCSLEGVDARGELCAVEDIPRFTDENGVDQFGINASTGLNRFGCDIYGRNASGEVCALSEMPRIFDDKGFDQNKLNAAGMNSKGCGLNGFTLDGKRCAPEDIPRLYNAKGIDQLGLSKQGFNSFGCDLNGKREDGSSCPLSEVTRIFDPATGLDQFGLTEDGFNAKGCSLEGVNRSGELCDPEDIPRVYGDDGLDQLGFGKDGYNKNNCDYYGYDRSGKLCQGKDMTRVFSDKGVDQYGTDKRTGRNEHGCDLDGMLPNGKRCKPANQISFVNSSGVDQYGFLDKYNENGCDINGLDREGKRCSLKDVTRIVDPKTGLDQIGLLPSGVNEHGCDINGLDSLGEPCDASELTHWRDKNGVDQFGLLENGRNDKGCNLLGFKPDGSRCSFEDTPSIMGKNGLNQLGLMANGFGVDGMGIDGRNVDGCDIYNKKADGTYCDKYQDLNLDAEDGVEMAKMQALMDALITEVAAQPVSVDIKSEYKDTVAEAVVGQDAYNAPVLSPQESSFVAAEQQGLDAQSGTGFVQSGTGRTENLVVNIPTALMATVYVKTPVNSDYTELVKATITMGELEGAELIGKPVIPDLNDPVMDRDKMYYHFTQMVYNRQTIAIDAITIDMWNDSGMVEADSVDYHRFQRYGGLVVASAVQALDASFLDSQAERDAAQQASEIESALQSTVVYGENTRELTKQNMKVATSYVSDLAREQFNRRPTVRKGPGPHVIIFRKEVRDPRLPIVVMSVD